MAERALSTLGFLHWGGIAVNEWNTRVPRHLWIVGALTSLWNAVGTSIVGMVLTGIYSYVLTDGMALMGTGGAVFTAVIWLIAFSLFFYARAMARRGVLR
jgi:hypothetical protein